MLLQLLLNRHNCTVMVMMMMMMMMMMMVLSGWLCNKSLFNAWVVWTVFSCINKQARKLQVKAEKMLTCWHVDKLIMLLIKIQIIEKIPRATVNSQWRAAWDKAEFEHTFWKRVPTEPQKNWTFRKFERPKMAQKWPAFFPQFCLTEKAVPQTFCF